MEWVVILAGGSGSRFWPLSTPSHPKQLLPLAGPTPTALGAVQAIASIVPRDRILVVTSKALAGPLQRELKLPQANVLVEPSAASTAPALVWATHEVQRRDAGGVVLSMHADWLLRDPARFAAAARQALATAASSDFLVTTGVIPTRAEPGYGYIVPGEPLGAPARRVARFTEKPSREEAERLISGGALWNSGLFAWRAARLLGEVAAHTPEIARALALLDAGQVVRFFAEVTPIAIDTGLLERSDRVAVIPADFPWDDVGTWDALGRVRERDPSGNATHGPAHLVDATGCVVWSSRIPIVVAGVKDLVVVEANGRILVMHRSRTGDLKKVLEQLPPEVRDVR